MACRGKRWDRPDCGLVAAEQKSDHRCIMSAIAMPRLPSIPEVAIQLLNSLLARFPPIFFLFSCPSIKPRSPRQPATVTAKPDLSSSSTFQGQSLLRWFYSTSTGHLVFRAVFNRLPFLSPLWMVEAKHLDAASNPPFCRALPHRPRRNRIPPQPLFQLQRLFHSPPQTRS